MFQRTHTKHIHELNFFSSHPFVTFVANSLSWFCGSSYYLHHLSNIDSCQFKMSCILAGLGSLLCQDIAGLFYLWFSPFLWLPQIGTLVLSPSCSERDPAYFLIAKVLLHLLQPALITQMLNTSSRVTLHGRLLVYMSCLFK